MVHSLPYHSPLATTSTVLEISGTWAHSVRNIEETLDFLAEKGQHLPTDGGHIKEKKSSTSVQRGYPDWASGPNGHRRSIRKPVFCVTWPRRAAGGLGILKAGVMWCGRPINHSASANGSRSPWSCPGKETLDSPEGLGALVAQGSQMSRHRKKGRLDMSLHPSGRKEIICSMDPPLDLI